MTRQEYDALQQELSDLLEKKDLNGVKIRRSQDYKDAVLASKSVVHNWFLFRNKEEPKQVVRKQCKKEHPDGTIDYYAEWYCPHCGSILKRGYGAEWIKCCFRCGKPVIWESEQDVERKQDASD